MSFAQVSCPQEWGKIISRLIQAGHAWSEIKDYTIPQLKLFAKYAQEIDQEKRAVMMADNAIASQGTGKAIASKIKELLGRN